MTLLQAAEEFDQVAVGGLTSSLVSLLSERNYRADFFPPYDLGRALHPGIQRLVWRCGPCRRSRLGSECWAALEAARLSRSQGEHAARLDK